MMQLVTLDCRWRILERTCLFLVFFFFFFFILNLFDRHQYSRSLRTSAPSSSSSSDMATTNTPAHLYPPLPPRTLLIRAHPSPRTLAERRAVLLAVERLCPLEVFRRVPGRFLAVAATAEATARLLAATGGVVRYAVALPTVLEGGEDGGAGQRPNMAQAGMPLWGASLRPVLFPPQSGIAASAAAAATAAASSITPAASPAPSILTKEFVLALSSAPWWNHAAERAAAEPVDAQMMPDVDGLMETVLRQRVPAGVAAAGLSRWDDVVGGAKNLEGGGGGGGGVAREQQQQQKQQQNNAAMARARKEAKARTTRDAEMLPGEMLRRWEQGRRGGGVVGRGQ
jgi:hypothetical protein